MHIYLFNACTFTQKTCSNSNQATQLDDDGTFKHLWFLFYIRPSARRGLKFTLGRHLRSKRRCSCVLQFTRLRAVSCVLHRPTSRVIHHSRLMFFIFLSCYVTTFTIFAWFKLGIALVYWEHINVWAEVLANQNFKVSTLPCTLQIIHTITLCTPSIDTMHHTVSKGLLPLYTITFL